MARGVLLPSPAKKEEDPKEAIEVNAEKLASNDIDLPEEPENVDLFVEVWDGTRWVEKAIGTRLIVPTKCKRAEYADPLEACVKLKSALPRDKEKDTNLYASWQTNGWVSRAWAQERLDEGIDREKIDAEIRDDIPLMLSMKGQEAAPPDGGAAQVAQTPGMSPGSAEAGITPSQAKGKQ